MTYTKVIVTTPGVCRLILKASYGHWTLILGQMQTTPGLVVWPSCCACSGRALVTWLKPCWPTCHICRCVAVSCML